jgi:simple sugar transport system permease protein
MSNWRARLTVALAAPLIALVAAVAVSSLALLVSGHSPVEAFRAMVTYVDSTESVVNIINRAVPYYVAGVAVAIGFKMNLFNIGVDGQYRLAALLAAAAGAAVSLPAVLHVGLIMVVAMAVGGAYAAIPGVLKVTRGVNEVVSTIMLNFIATGLSAYLLSVYLRDESSGLVTGTEPLPDSGRLPPLNGLLEDLGFHLPQGVVLRSFLPFAVLIGIVFYLVVYRTRFGFELRTSGENPAAATSAGVNPKAMVMKTIVFSGVVAGLIGMGPLLTDLHKYADQFPFTLGFTGIAIALLGRNNPAGIAVGALVWATIERASQALNPIGIPQEIGRILQGSLLLSAVIAFEVVRRWAAAMQVREAAAATGGASTGQVPPGPGAEGLAGAPL